MADRNDHTGGLVKKLLFPAAASGANDTFRANDNVNSDDGTTSSSSDRTSPTTSTTKQQQQPTTTTTDPRKFPIEETAHDAITPVTGPPRFFSSTHPTAASEADGHKKKSGSSRVVSHWQTQQKESPQKQNGENSNLQTPARAPPSPPPLDRCLDTPASDVSANQELEEQYQCEEESAQDSPFDETEIDNDDSLQFLKQFKAKHDKQSPHKISGADNDDAETEVHNNTTAYHQFRKQQIQHQQTEEVDEENTEAASEILSRQPENSEAEPKKSFTEEEEQDETTEKCPTNDEKQTPNTPLSTTNKSDEDCTDKDLHGYDHKASPHNAMEYPSYYDNPYHNPLVASALKPNDLFRNPANDDDDGDDSDVDSNASEMGTVINAPNLFASRFSEVDAMERENDNGGFGFDVDDDNHHHDDIILDDEDDDPVITNYKAFRAHDDDDDDDENDVDTIPKEDDSAATDPFQTPSMPANREQDTKIGEQQLGDRVAKNEPSAFDENDKHHTPDTMAEQGEHHRVDSGRDSRAQTTEFESKQPLHHPSVNKVLWKKEDGQEDSSSSDIDSEIDQLVRRSASESSAGGIVKSCSSNNSADIFRAPSAGSDHGSSRRIHATNHQPKHSNGNIIPPNRIPPRKLGEAVNKKEEEKKEDLQEKFQQQGSPSSRISPKDEIQATYSNMFKAEEDPPPLEEESGGNPASNLANTIRRIGSKLTKKTSPSNRYFFDIEDEVDEDNSLLEQSQTDNHLDQSQNDNDFQERNSASAPTTPRQQRDDKRQQQQQHYQNSGNHHYSLSKIQEAFPQSPGKESTTSSQVDSLNAPASFLLRSPGSSARLMADFRRESSGTSGNGSSPENENDKHKFGFLKQRIPSILQSASSASLGTGPTPRATGGGRRDQFRNNQPITPSRGANALRYARGCLSFDTTTDQQYDYDFERETAMFEAAADGAEEITSSKSFDARHQRQSSPMRTSKAFRQRFMGFRDEDVKKTNSTQALYGSSRSWDVKSGVASSLWSAAAGVGDGNKDDLEQPAAVHLDASAFRNAPYVRQRNKLHHPHPNGFNNNNGQKIVSGERQHRLRLMSDTNTLPSQNRETLEVLQTPQRIEIEREDALNLLACLCERGVSLYPKEDSDISKHSTSQGKPSKDEEMGVENEGNSTILTANDRHEQKSKESPDFRHRKLPSELEPETIDAVVEALRKRSGAEFTPTERKDKGMTPPSEPDHEMIVHVLDELRRSHIYAHEMKRASLSASAWLRSIGHSASSSEGMYYQVSQGSTKTGARQAAGEREGGVEHSSGDSNNDTVDLLTVKAMLHQVQIEAREKEAEAKRLNEELSKCRAEIGRLKSESRSKVHTMKLVILNGILSRILNPNKLSLIFLDH